MRTIPASRARTISAALRTRSSVLGAAALMSAALVLGPVSPATAQSTPSGATAAASPTTWKRTSDNLLATPYFENRIWPWVGPHLTRQHLANAPDGNIVARVGNTNNRVTIDDWPGEAKSTLSGHLYTASAKVA